MTWDQDVSTAQPGSEASAPGGGAQERRQFIRAATVLKARLVTEQATVEGTVMDASLNGVKIWVAGDVPVGSKVTLILAGSVHFGGKVAWRLGETLGICFQDEPEKVATIMAALLPQRCLQVGHA